MADKPVKVEIVGDSSNYKKALHEAESASGQFADKTKGHSVAVAGAAAIATGAVGAFLHSAVDAASDLNETVGKTKVVMGSAADDAISFAEDAASSFGLSEQAAVDAESTFAVFGKSAGLAGEELGGFSKDLTGLAADMASFSNTSPEQAIEAIGAALRGESEPIRAYGVQLDDARLRQRAMTMGIYDGTGSLTAQQKVLAAQAEIFAQTGDAQGDFARTSDGLAGQTKILTAEFENMKVKLGGALIPLVSKLVSTLNGLVAGGDASADSFDALNRAMDTGQAYQVINAFQDLIKATGDARSGFDKAQHGAGAFFDELAGGGGDSVRNFDKAFGDLAKKTPESAAAVVESLRAVLESAEAGNERSKEFVDQYDLTIGKLDEMSAALPRVGAAAIETDRETRRLTESSKGLDDTTADVNDTLADNAVRSAAARQATDNLKASWDTLKDSLSDQQAWIDVEKSFDDVKQKGQEAFKAQAEGAVDARSKALDYQSALLDLKGKVIDYANEVGGLPPERVTTILAQIDEGSIHNAEQVLDAIAHARQVIYNAQVAGHREFASGTNSAPPGLALVGERGPELMVMGGGEQVIPAGPTAALMNGAMGGNTFNVTIAPPVGTSPDEIVRSLAKYVQRNGPSAIQKLAGII